MLRQSAPGQQAMPGTSLSRATMVMHAVVWHCFPGAEFNTTGQHTATHRALPRPSPRPQPPHPAPRPPPLPHLVLAAVQAARVLLKPPQHTVRVGPCATSPSQAMQLQVSCTVLPLWAPPHRVIVCVECHQTNNVCSQQGKLRWPRPAPPPPNPPVLPPAPATSGSCSHMHMHPCTCPCARTCPCTRACTWRALRHRPDEGPLRVDPHVASVQVHHKQLGEVEAGGHHQEVPHRGGKPRTQLQAARRTRRP